MIGARPGERRLPFDPGQLPPQAGLVFIGRVNSPWRTRAECPKNMAAARERAVAASVEIDERYRDGLAGLEAFSHATLLTWLDRSPRDLIVQSPRHADAPRGTFALRSPARPNPVGLHVVRITGIDRAAGRIELETIDVLDGTPVIDVKPYYPSTDAVPDATTARSGAR